MARSDLKTDDTGVQINFDARATLRKWPSLQNARISAADGGRPYSIFDGTLDDCIRQFMAKPASQRPLYETHTSQQGERQRTDPDHVLDLVRRHGAGERVGAVDVHRARAADAL